MKLKKILALACSLVMTASMFVATANAAVNGATVTLSSSVENIEGYDYIKVVVSATIPDTLVPYEVTAGGPPSFTQTYKGKMLQLAGIEIPQVSGAMYIDALSSVAGYLQKKADENVIKIYTANMGDYSTYYAGEVDVLATLYFYAADMSQTYEFKVESASIGLVDVAANGTVTPYSYVTDDFTITNAVVKPEEPEPEPDPEPAAALAVSATDVTPENANGYIWDVTVTKGEGGALVAFDALFTDKDGNTAERTIRTGLDVLNSKLTVADGNGSVAFKVGLKTEREISSAKFTVTDVADATATCTAE